MHRSSRRRVLATTATGLVAAVAGCSTGSEETTAGDDGSDGGDDATPDDGAEETTPDDDTGDATAGDGGSGDGGDGGNGGGETETTAGSTDSGTIDGAAATVVVGPGGDFVFSPDSVLVAVGETVEWTWESGGHNVVVEGQPDGADWGGTEGDASTTYGSGHSTTHTFETAGTFTYYCSPHRGLGMTGEVVVEDG